MNFENLSPKELYSDETINVIMDEPDPVTREQMKFSLLDRASEFGEKTEKRVESILKIAEKDLKSKINQKNKKSDDNSFDRYTDFGERYPAMKCGKWVAGMHGIQNPDALPNDRFACPHPILPVEIITNVETGTKKSKIAYYRGGRWFEKIVQKSIIFNKNIITKLSDFGIAVTSETAKNLVCYLYDVENMNFDDIPEVLATAKMGWTDDGFMPYTSDLIFDKDGRFDALFGTISEFGKYETWLEFVKSVRKSGRIEPRAVMAASFASVLIKPCGLLPFWFDIWGKTGGGKSVCGLLAASIWAEPEIGKFVSKFESTIPAFEARAGFLNHLPFIIDDTAQLRKKLKDDFSQLIYQLASGEGKDRSNTELGLARKSTWYNIIIASGESPIINDQLQGGAVNRVIEYEVDDGNIFEDGQYAATLLKNNYGFAGKLFVEMVEKMGFPEVQRIQQECFNQIKSSKYEDKQTRSISVMLTADRIATDAIFKDGIYLSYDDLKRTLTDIKTLSENQRCYDYIMNECAVNVNQFQLNDFGKYTGEAWGKYEQDEDGNELVIIQSNIFRRMCSEGGYSDKSFLSWASKKNLILHDSQGKNTLPKKIAGRYTRCVCLKCPEESLDETGEIDDITL